MTYYPSTYNHLGLDSGVNVSYIAAGSTAKPTVLLLHGFPSSSNQYRNLITLLAVSYHVIAPDLPGYGFTTTPAGFVHNFENLTKVIGSFLEALKVTSYAVYIFDYGAPVAIRLALKDPKPIKAIVSQNGNAYVEGFGHPFWTPVEALWDSGNAQANRDAIAKAVLTPEATKWQYTEGFPTKDLPLVNPVAYTLDYHENLETPEQKEVQLDLLYDYRTNIPLYAPFQKYLRESKVPVLAIWGKGDKIFVPPGAEAFKRDAKDAIVKFVDAGHFALETKVQEIGNEILHFLKKVKF